MKRLLIRRLFVLLSIFIIGGVRMAAKNVIINAPKITPNSCNYNGTIIPVITADEGCSIVYVKSTKQVYTTIEAIDAAKGVKTEASNEATITDIQGKCCQKCKRD